MTNEELQRAIEANTAAIAHLAANAEQTNQAINMLVSEFIRPATKQARDNYERLERVEGYIVSIAEQQQASAQQIAQSAESITRFDQRLEETRQLVAKNASEIAQLTVKQGLNADQISANAQQITALAEASRTQLAAIIGNGRRIDRLEQQAS